MLDSEVKSFTAEDQWETSEHKKEMVLGPGRRGVEAGQGTSGCMDQNQFYNVCPKAGAPFHPMAALSPNAAALAQEVMAVPHPERQNSV